MKKQMKLFAAMMAAVACLFILRMPVSAYATTPSKVTNVGFGATKTSVTIYATKPADAEGLQLQRYDLKTKKYSKKDFTGYSVTTATKQDKAYKFRVRGYNVDNETGERVYGAWSSWKYTMYPTVELRTYSNQRGINVKFKKCPQVHHFNVYVSTKYDSGYKLTTSVKRFSSNTKTIRVTKMGKTAMKKSTYYYVKVVPVFRSNGKNYSSQLYVYAGMVNPR